MAGKKYLLNQQFFKPNYYKALEFIVPQYLKEDDITNFGTTVDLEDKVINSNIDSANNISSILLVSSIQGTYFSSMSSIEGISPYFVKQNGLTDISPYRFENAILSKLGKSFSDYTTSAEFSEYLTETLLPSIVLNSPSAVFNDGDSVSATHVYLIENLSWMYFLNTSGSIWSPSSYVHDQLVEKLFKGNSILINDGIKGFMEFLWKNGYTSYYPSEFTAGSDTFTSGTQQLDNLKTWIDVIYSPLYADSSDFSVRDRFDMFIESNLKSESTIPNGPFTKLLRSLSFLAFDINNDTDLLSTLYDIDDCPDDYLPLIAELIGWDLFGSDPQRWRLQIRNAVEIYKSVGTKKSIQFALNTIFPKNAFPIESRITELYESYVPYLIYYALATESSKFKSFATWNPTVSNDMGVSGYSTSSLDTNIRLAVDKILLELYEKFPSRFGNIPNKDKGFFYRGRSYPIPPFEEYPYYVNIELSPDMIEFLADRLVCFGVTNQFALDTSGYIKSNTIDVDDEPRAGSMLFFTSGYNDPPNLGSLILNLNDQKFEYASLWSGKSSHFKLVFDASEFDFLKTDVALGDTDSRDAFFIASKITHKLAPAHSIPIVSLELSSIDYATMEASALPLIALDKVELDSGAHRNKILSGIVLGTYKRGETGGVTVSRGYSDNLYTEAYLNAVDMSTLDRKTIRRRSLEKLMPFNGYYDRTGFNMPVAYYMDSSLSGIPLGFIPSSMSFEDITDYVNLPGVYSVCEGSGSPRSYYGYDVSNTLLCRGNTPLGLTSKHLDRGQLPTIYDSMHTVGERQKVLESEESYGAVDDYTASVSSVYQSQANLLTELSGAFPNSVNDYYNYSFGRDFSRLYQVYTRDFGRHAIAPHIGELDGTNIFSHVFGPILVNGDLQDLGVSSDSVVASSLASVSNLTTISETFLGPLSYAASTANSMYIDSYDRVVSGIVNNVELIHTSGSPVYNSFSVFKIGGEYKTLDDDPYMFDRVFISSKSRGSLGLSRIRFDMSKYGQPSHYPLDDTFLLPDHKFKCNIRALVTNSAGTTLGGSNSTLGVWIHTKPENGSMWSYKGGNWTQHSQLISRRDLLDNYAILKKFPKKTKEELNNSRVSNLKCLDIVTGITGSISPVARLRESDFTNFEIEFDTFNRFLTLPKDYRDIYPTLHRKDQEYVIEVFILPSQALDDIMLLDSVSMQDITLRTMAGKFVGGKYQDPLCYLPYMKGGCKEYRVMFTKEELMNFLRFFNDIAGKNSTAGNASRNSALTEAIMGSNGGSRVEYRTRRSWSPVTYAAGTNDSIPSEVLITV